MTGWYSSSWKARSLEYGEGGGFPPPFSYATKQSGGDKTHRPPDTAARLRPTKQPVCFTTERAVCDTLSLQDFPKMRNLFFNKIFRKAVSFNSLVSNTFLLHQESLLLRKGSWVCQAKIFLHARFPRWRSCNTCSSPRSHLQVGGVSLTIREFLHMLSFRN